MMIWTIEILHRIKHNINLSRWSFSNLEIFAKKHNTIDLHLWSHVGPIIIILTIDLLWNTEKNHKYKFQAWFIVDLEKLMKNFEPLDF